MGQFLDAIKELPGRGLDWAIAQVNPRRALHRRHLREMANNFEYRELALALYRARGYRAADKGRQNTFWGSNGSADAHLGGGQLSELRDRSRELARDDSLASGLVNKFVTNVVGTGIRPQARTDSVEKNRAMEAVWTKRKDKLFAAEDSDQEQGQRLIMGRLFEDGEILIKRTMVDPTEPVWIELIEADRLDSPSPLPSGLPAGHTIRHGVEKDQYGRPTAYWLRKRHPGDSLDVSAVADARKFYPVSARSIRHPKIKKRAGQTRGVPAMHAIAQDLRDLDLLMLASLKRTQVAACLAAFIKSDLDIPDLTPTTKETATGYKIDQEIVPGMIFKLAPNESLETLIPNFPVPELFPFIVMLCRRIGSALGISWQIVLNDFGDSTYSSARTDLLESRPSFTILQRYLINNALHPIWRWVLEDARMRGDLAGVTDEDLDAVNWIPPGWRWVDPFKEAQGAKLELEMGTTTLQILCAQKGLDWEEIARQRARELELLTSLGLPSPFSASGVANAPDAPPEPVKKQLLGFAAKRLESDE